MIHSRVSSVTSAPIPRRSRSFSFDVLDAAGKRIDGRLGDDIAWGEYEEYGKSWYWVGPEIGRAFASTTLYPAGTYRIGVFNTANTGEYVLAVGDCITL